jgi:hypothetical protein
LKIPISKTFFAKNTTHLTRLRKKLVKTQKLEAQNIAEEVRKKKKKK